MSPPVAEISIETALNIARIFKVPASIKSAPPNIASNSVVQNSRQKTINGQNNSATTMVDAIDFSKKVIDKYFKVKDIDSVDAMYVINYKSGGFLVVSASKKEHPILAYSDDNSFPEEITQTDHPINSWLAASSDKIRALRKNLIKNKDSLLIQSEWQKYGDSIVPSGQTNSTGKLKVDVSQCPTGYHWDYTLNQCVACPSGTTWNGSACVVPTPPPCQTEYTIGPLVQTKWSQGCTFNTYAPTDTDPTNCNHTVAGCEAVAIGQIFKFWHTGNVYIPPYIAIGVNGTYGLQTYNYSDAAMPFEYPAGNETARLLRDIGTAVNMTYSPPASGMQAESSANVDHPAFFKTAGFTSPVAEVDYNINDVLGEISYGRPCLLGGFTYAFLPWNAEGHEWICDGLHAIPNTCYPTYWSGYSVTVHLNWGWGGYCNGWYLPGSWIPVSNGVEVGPRFLHDETEVVNIWLGSGYPTYGGGS
ncbi:MAG: C10 family peptidase [Bacteroidetes bacterium]|nr:C10 family peptidase [Bacteroidota bacterium]